MAWHAKNYGAYVSWSSSGGIYTLTPTTEGEDNMAEAWGVYDSLGYSKNAVSAILGVQCFESGLNPWRWQSDQMIASTDTYNIYTDTTHGYGLNQFTPMGTYINGAQGYFPTFAPNYADVAGLPHDGDAQCRFVNRACESLGYYFRWSSSQADYATYPYLPFADFKVTQITDFTYLVNQWLWNYSRGIAESSASLAMRVSAAEYIYDFLGGLRRRLPIWLLWKMSENTRPRREVQ